AVYKAVFEGAGLNWFFHFGNYHIDIPFTNHQVWFWWNTSTNTTAAYNLTQTLLTTTPLILTGLAVAFAFRCGLFNIGGQGQYLVGAIVGVYVGSRFVDMAHIPHVLLAIALASLAGAVWGGIAGFLKATVGAHEVITTIMLNWIAYWGGSYFFGRGGPLQNHQDVSIPISDDIAKGAHLSPIWGNPALQALHSGIFIAIGALIAFYIILNRTTLGYEVRAVGFNPEAARYGGISVGRNFVIAMGISGLFAGLAGVIDILGWQFRLGVLDVQVSNIGFIGIAVALLGRNTAVGVGLAALLFGALLTGTSTRSLDPNIFPPQLAGNLALMIQALVLLFVGADLLIIYIWQARKKLRLTRGGAKAAEEPA
ncbi:MAG TPA: ABC transporter permease, partial [Caldimonas sp.]|nr:ABC transporter permease [Caldimonas sp.]